MTQTTFLTHALLAAVLSVPLAACGDDDGHDHDHGSDAAPFDCSMEPRAEPYVANLLKEGTTVKVTLVSNPAPPSKGDNTWTIKVTDMSDTPLDGLTIDATPFMPDHGHGTPIEETTTAGTNAGEHILTPINLWMPGYWEVTIDLSDGANLEDSVLYKACIDG